MAARRVGSLWRKEEIVKRDLSKVLMPDHPLYTEAVEALKLYHQAQARGVVGAELERQADGRAPLPGGHRLPVARPKRAHRERSLTDGLHQVDTLHARGGNLPCT